MHFLPQPTNILRVDPRKFALCSFANSLHTSLISLLDAIVYGNRNICTNSISCVWVFVWYTRTAHNPNPCDVCGAFYVVEQTGVLYSQHRCWQWTQFQNLFRKLFAFMKCGLFSLFNDIILNVSKYSSSCFFLCCSRAWFLKCFSIFLLLFVSCENGFIHRNPMDEDRNISWRGEITKETWCSTAI